MKKYIQNTDKIREIVQEMYDSNEYMCGLNEIVSAVCGRRFYGNYDDEDLSYVESVLKEVCNINVSFDLDNEVMNYEGIHLINQ